MKSVNNKELLKEMAAELYMRLTVAAVTNDNFMRAVQTKDGKETAVRVYEMAFGAAKWFIELNDTYK